MLNHSPRIVTDGLVYCLDAGNLKSFNNGVDSTTWYDMISRPQISNYVALDGCSFTSPNAITFNGTTDNGISVSNCGLTGSVTIQAFVKPSYNSGPHKTIACTDKTHQYGAKLMNYKNNARYGLWVGKYPVDYEAFVSADINDGNPKMVTGSWDSSSGYVTMYLNDAQTGSINTGITGALMLYDGYICVGTDYHAFGNDQNYYGDIYTVFIYDRVLFSDEVSLNYKTLKKRFGL